MLPFLLCKGRRLCDDVLESVARGQYFMIRATRGGRCYSLMALKENQYGSEQPNGVVFRTSLSVVSTRFTVTRSGVPPQWKLDFPYIDLSFWIPPTVFLFFQIYREIAGTWEFLSPKYRRRRASGDKET
ncbi:hypothetical protein ARMGADRAFT_1081323 [Armillaria gallica]|uniref:Uncharacterized protein n=1 Tax=Armillaria gallica TaxID=47427 RepID=A0A2H3D9H5_ARMGA|nr:hypothetical protein ARMGADRAFT_1081323 [Armillaria gallica]